MFISIKDRELEYCERMPLRLLGCRCGGEVGVGSSLRSDIW